MALRPLAVYPRAPEAVRWGAMPLARSLLAARPRIPERHPLVIPLAVAYAALIFGWCYLRHRHFGSSAFELGAYHTVLWNIAYRGTPWNSLERAHQWSTHLELGLAPLVPLYRIFPTPAWLWLAEGAACGAAALPLDALARRVTGDRVVGLLAAAAMLLTPQLVLGQVADFQPIALAILPMAVIAWAIEADSSRGLVLGSLWAILLREQLGAVVAVAAVLWVLRHGMRRAPPAFVLAVLAVTVSAVEIFYILPSFGSEESARYAAQYGSLGAGGGSHAHVLLGAFTAGRRAYLLGLVSGAFPLVVLSLRSLRRSAWPLLLGLPPLAVQLLSAEPRKWDLDYPYGVPVVAAIAAAAVLALRFLPGETAGDEARPDLDGRRIAAAAWLGMVVIHLASILPTPAGPGRALDPSFSHSLRAAALTQAIALVPADASITAQDDIVPHVAERSEIHRWPDGMDTDEYVLLDLEGNAANLRSRSHLVSAGRQLRGDPAFQLLVDQAGVILAKRVSPR
jgi:uncharacterized membrane protein